MCSRCSKLGSEWVSSSLSWPSWELGCQLSRNPRDFPTPWLTEALAPLGSSLPRPGCQGLRPTQRAPNLPPPDKPACPWLPPAVVLVHLLHGQVIYGPGWVTQGRKESLVAP